jgi:hypothetical protein
MKNQKYYIFLYGLVNGITFKCSIHVGNFHNENVHILAFMYYNSEIRIHSIKFTHIIYNVYK